MNKIFVLLKEMLIGLYQYLDSSLFDFVDKDSVDKEIFDALKEGPTSMKALKKTVKSSIAAAVADVKQVGETIMAALTTKDAAKQKEGETKKEKEIDVTKQKVEIAVNLYNKVKEAYNYKVTYDLELTRQKLKDCQAKENSEGLIFADNKQGHKLLLSTHSLEFMELLLNLLKELEDSILGIKELNRNKEVGTGDLLPLVEKQLIELRKAINGYLREKQAEKYMDDLEKRALNLAVELQKYRIKRGEQLPNADRLKPNIGIEPDAIDKLRLKAGNAALTKRKLALAKELFDLAHRFSNTKHPIEEPCLSWMEYVQPMYQGLKRKNGAVKNMRAGLLNTIIANAVDEFELKMKNGV